MNRFLSHRLLLIACACAVSFASSTSFAQDAPDADEAKPVSKIPKYEELSPERQSEVASLLELAKNNEARGDYAKALGHYKDAYKLFAHPKLLFSIASMYERNADKRNARVYYQFYVDALPEGPQAKVALKRIAQLKDVGVKKETSLRVESSPPGATVYLNDIVNGPSGTTPTTDLPIKAGTYSIILRLDGYEDYTQDVVVDAGERAVIKFPLKKVPELNPQPKDSSSSALPWVLVGVGVVGVGVGAGFLYASTDVDGLDSPNSAQRLAAEEDAEFYQTIGGVSMLVGAVSFAGALVYFLTQDDGVALNIPTGADSSASVSWPSVWMGQEGGGVSVQGRF